MSLREMFAVVLLYHGVLLFLLVMAASVFSWHDMILFGLVAFTAWMAGGQTCTYVFDNRHEENHQ